MVPVREKPSDRSQMINQLLLGDIVDIKDRYKNWIFIETLHDGYSGWMDGKQISLLSDSFFEQMENETPVFMAGRYAEIKGEGGNNLPLIMGSRLPVFNHDIFHLEKAVYKFPKNIPVLQGKQTPKVLIETAKKYLGSPYLWGGRSFFGNDCSGFTQIVYRMCGYKLLRDASQQAKQGSLVSFINQALPSDLAFFENEEGNIVHVGIMLNANEIIHSSGQVRIDTIDHEGIFNKKLKRYTHKLRVIRRVIT